MRTTSVDGDMIPRFTMRVTCLHHLSLTAKLYLRFALCLRKDAKMGLEGVGNRSGSELVSSWPTHPTSLVPLQGHADRLGRDRLLGSPFYMIFSSSSWSLCSVDTRAFSAPGPLSSKGACSASSFLPTMFVVCSVYLFLLVGFCCSSQS